MYPIKAESDVPLAFKIKLTMVEKLSLRIVMELLADRPVEKTNNSREVKLVQSDNGGEYLSKMITSYSRES